MDSLAAIESVAEADIMKANATRYLSGKLYKWTENNRLMYRMSSCWLGFSALGPYNYSRRRNFACMAGTIFLREMDLSHQSISGTGSIDRSCIL